MAAKCQQRHGSASSNEHMLLPALIPKNTFQIKAELKIKAHKFFSSFLHYVKQLLFLLFNHLSHALFVFSLLPIAIFAYFFPKRFFASRLRHRGHRRCRSVYQGEERQDDNHYCAAN